MRKYLFLLTGLMTMLACPLPASAAPAFSVNAVATDTVRYTVPCGAAANNALCRVTIKDSLSNATLAQVDIPVGSSYTGKMACPAPNTRVVILARAFGVTAAGSVSAAWTDGRGEAFCPDVVPTPPPPFTINVVIIGGG